MLMIQEHYGKTIQTHIEQQILTDQISDLEGLYLNAVALYVPEQLPEVYENFDAEVIKSGFGVSSALRLNWEKFSIQQQSILKASAYRPSADTSIVTPGGRFRIHYSMSGSNAIDLEDSDGNQIPDYIDAVSSAADSAYMIEVEFLGFKAPLSDDNIDGPEWDIYVRNLPSVYGQTTPEKQVSSNPDQYYGYMELDNNYQHTYTKGLPAMRVTLVHEFFHMIHMAYNLRSTNYFKIDDLFLMEASSTWMEDYVYDNVNDYYAYLNPFFSQNNVPFDYTGNNHEYGLALWWHYIQNKYESTDLIRETWETVVEQPGLQALNTVLKTRGSSFNEAMTEFYGWNIMTGDRSDPSRFYEEGAFYPQIVFDKTDSIDTDAMYEILIQPLSVRYFYYKDSENSEIILAPVNVTNGDQNSTNVCQVLMHKGNDKPGYTSIGNGFYAALISEDDWQWQFAASVRVLNTPWNLNTFYEQKEGFGASISGLVFKDTNADGNYQTGEPGLEDLTLNLCEIGPDSLFLTNDDVVYPVQLSQTDGSFQFTGLGAGNYYLYFDEPSIPPGMLFSTRNTPLYLPVEENETIEDIVFGFRAFEETELPTAIPQPYLIQDSPHLKIPFPCDESGNYTVYIYSSSGYCLFSEEQSFDAADVQFFEWTGIDTQGQQVPSGIYFYVIESNEKCIRKEKIAVIR